MCPLPGCGSCWPGGGTGVSAPQVYGYILMNRLYGTHADLKRLELPELRACSYSMIRAKRVPHVMGVEEEAVRLAERWGGDEGMARRAAILHDCTKYLELDDQLRLCRQYGVELDELEQQAVKLLHAKTGACIARDIFGEPDEVYQAIFWHTTAKADMTLLEKIIYIADYIEPNRDFEGWRSCAGWHMRTWTGPCCWGWRPPSRRCGTAGSPSTPIPSGPGTG